MSRYRSGPSPLLVIMVGALVVFGGYFVWKGFLNFLEDQGDITAQVTRQAVASATARAAPLPVLPTIFIPPTFTPLPPCIWFEVAVDRAVYRECPSTDDTQCPIREVILYGTQLCVYSRVPGNIEWYVVDLNHEGAYRDTVYVHESVVEALNPTPTITHTYTPWPTITRTLSPTPLSVTPTPTVPGPTPTSSPQSSPAPSRTPLPSVTPLPPDTLPPSPTPPDVSI
ncbi:MAG: hypothetical protein K8S97_05875 [Anaerolineae bacterium]|nr:hypothetical protein [Anaerolineae bacterium]